MSTNFKALTEEQQKSVIYVCINYSEDNTLAMDDLYAFLYNLDLMDEANMDALVIIEEYFNDINSYASDKLQELQS